MWGLRNAMPKRSTWRTVQFDTLRLRLIKIAARVTELKTMIRVSGQRHVPINASSGSPSLVSRTSSPECPGKHAKSNPSVQPANLLPPKLWSTLGPIRYA
jgi:hypothetical protein